MMYDVRCMMYQSNTAPLKAQMSACANIANACTNLERYKDAVGFAHKELKLCEQIYGLSMYLSVVCGYYISMCDV